MCKKIWDVFGIKIMGDYHDHYQKKDVLFLADVFENFIDTCIKFYGLDACHYFGSPGLSWNAMLKMTEIELEKISDTNEYLFIEKGLRGGIFYITKRYSKANNKYMKVYDSKELSNFITYLDMNNLYGSRMSGYLPYDGFKSLKNVDGFDVTLIGKKTQIGYIIEVDLEYLDELHQLHNDYPLAPEQLAISYDMLSDYCKKIADEYGIKAPDAKKLIPNSGSKTNYVVHYRNLQLYLSLGMKLTKIHRVLKFKQSDWMKKYIDFNTEKRKNAANDFEKDFFKFMINSVYGKTIENLRKRINVQLVNNEKDFLKCTRNFEAIHEIESVLTLNKPIYVGFTVLELSKWLMYDFHYNFIKKHFDAELLFTDTDSLTYQSKLKDVYEEFFKRKYLFNFSSYPKDSRFFDTTNKKVIGKREDEKEGKIIDEFVGLKSKMYSIKNIDGKESNTTKGVNLTTEFNEFKNILFKKKIMRHKMKRIHRKKHKLGTYEINKISLSCFDDKRCIQGDSINTLAFFHKKRRLSCHK